MSIHTTDNNKPSRAAEAENSVPAGGGPIGEEEIRKAEKILAEYKRAKANLDLRVRENEQWYRLRHWQQLRKPDEREVHHSAWLFNSIVSKHADFMDATPQCTVLPREKADEPEAERLTAVLPVILERVDWPKVYSDAVYAKLKTGTAVYSVLWDPAAEDGLGEIAVGQTDLLNLYWEPGVREIQPPRICTTPAWIPPKRPRWWTGTTKSAWAAEPCCTTANSPTARCCTPPKTTRHGRRGAGTTTACTPSSSIPSSGRRARPRALA